MTVTIKTFQSGTGDSIFLRLEEREQNYTIMVDCGWYEGRYDRKECRESCCFSRNAD